MMTFSKFSNVTWFVLVIWLLYAYITITAPIGENVFELSQALMFWIRLSIAVPYLLVWVIASIGAGQLAKYGEKIYESVDGQAVSAFARGLYILLAGMIVTTIVSSFRSRWPEAAEVYSAPVQVFLNYAYVLFPLIAFISMLLGARKLSKVVSVMRAAAAYILPMLVAIGLAAVIYVSAVFTNPERQISVDNDPSYYISDLAIAITIVLPTVISWLLGVMVAVSIWIYQRNVMGSIYKKSLRSVSLGLMMVVLSSIILQYLISLGATRLLGLGIGLILAWIYVWLLALIVGYTLVGVGARRLSKIEE